MQFVIRNTMYVDIITPEKNVFSGEVDSVTVPGSKGEFQMLNHHDAIISTLVKGDVKIYIHNKAEIHTQCESIKESPKDKNILLYSVSDGIIELKDNKIIILVN